MNTYTQFFSYGENSDDKLCLHDGTLFGPITLAYETYGKLNKDKSNAILIFHALSGSQHVLGFNPNVSDINEKWTDECQKGWWDSFVGSKKMINTDDYFVICVNYLGGCYGTTGPGSIDPKTKKSYGGSFPNITFGDIVDSQLPLFNNLGISTFHAVIGSSLGGMLALNFSTRYPEKADRVITIACGLRSPILTKTHNLEQILAIENDANFNSGDYYETKNPTRGLILARMISHKTFVSLKYIKSRMKDRCIQDNDLSWYKIKTPLESYLLYQGHKFSKRFDANTYMHLMSAWSNFDLAKEHNVKNDEDIFKKCSHQKYLLFTINSDCCFYPEEQIELYQALKKSIIDATYVTVPSEKGHDSFLLEPELYDQDIRKALAS